MTSEPPPNPQGRQGGMADGKVVGELREPTPEKVLERMTGFERPGTGA